jgi:hypothetical protein
VCIYCILHQFEQKDTNTYYVDQVWIQVSEHQHDSYCCYGMYPIRRLFCVCLWNDSDWLDVCCNLGPSCHGNLGLNQHEHKIKLCTGVVCPNCFLWGECDCDKEMCLVTAEAFIPYSRHFIAFKFFICYYQHLWWWKSVIEGAVDTVLCLMYRVIKNDCRGFNNLSYTIHLT